MSQIGLKARLSNTIAKAEKELGWKLMIARSYVGVQRESKFLTIGPLLPIATNDDLRKWKDFFREDGWTEEEIATEYSKSATEYIKLYTNAWWSTSANSVFLSPRC